MKIFGIGMGRTGTTSLTHALRELGFSAKHFPRSYADIMNHDALTDTSIALGYKYLDFMFPDARFILTHRQVDAWLESVQAFFDELHKHRIDERYNRLHQSLYGTAIFDRKLMRESYLRHREEVTEYFRKSSRLLIIDVTRGEPYSALCDFLGVPVSPSPFPHLNDRLWMQENLPTMVRELEN